MTTGIAAQDPSSRCLASDRRSKLRARMPKRPTGIYPVTTFDWRWKPMDGTWITT